MMKEQANLWLIFIPLSHTMRAWQTIKHFGPVLDDTKNKKNTLYLPDSNGDVNRGAALCYPRVYDPLP